MHKVAMAVKRKLTKIEDKSVKATAQTSKPILLAVSSIRMTIAKIASFQMVSQLLSTVFYIIWILVGIFFLWFIVANFRVGAFDQLISRPQPVSHPPDQSQTPAETAVPGIGKVNVACVQKNLSEESIVKMVQEKSDKSLSDDEKKKLAECVLEKASPVTQASPSPKQ